MSFAAPPAEGNPPILWSTNLLYAGPGSVKSTAYASAVWPSANLAIAVPFVISSPGAVAYKLYTHNGITAAGNVDVGIYDESYNRLVSIGSTAQSGTSTIQVFDITDTALPRGRYYMAMAEDNGTSTFFRTTAANAAEARHCGMFQMAAAFALPATLTRAAPGQTYIPRFGVGLRTTV